MRKFQFRLQKVLEHRETLEEDAKQTFLSARAQTLEAEALLANMQGLRAQTAQQQAPTLADRLALERFIGLLKDREYDQGIVIQTLQDEEEGFRRGWIQARQDAEAIRKLKEKALEDWKLEADRKEQADLDEWAVLRRAA